MKKLMLSVFALAAVVLSANAIDATQTGTGRVDLVVPMQVSQVTGTDGQLSNLNFGRFAFIVGTGGVIDVRATVGSNAINEALTDLTEVAGGDLQSLAAFKVTGTADYDFSVSVPASLNLGTGVDITAFNTSLASNVGTIVTGGTTFYVGGTLEVGPTAAAGAYSQTFTVNVNYN